MKPLGVFALFFVPLFWVVKLPESPGALETYDKTLLGLDELFAFKALEFHDLKLATDGSYLMNSTDLNRKIIDSCKGCTKFRQCLAQLENGCDLIIRNEVNEDFEKEWRSKKDAIEKHLAGFGSSELFLEKLEQQDFSFAEKFRLFFDLLAPVPVSPLEKLSATIPLEIAVRHPSLIKDLRCLLPERPVFWSLKADIAGSIPDEHQHALPIFKRILPWMSKNDMSELFNVSFPNIIEWACIKLMDRREMMIKNLLRAYQDENDTFYSIVQRRNGIENFLTENPDICKTGLLVVCLHELQGVRYGPEKLLERYRVDFSATVYKLDPKIEWLSDDYVELDGIFMRPGRIRVFSNYDNLDDGRSFDLAIWQYVQVIGPPIEAHILFLEGGPGGYNGIEAKYFAALTFGSGHNAAFYRIDHRGLGGSGEFVDNNWIYKYFPWTDFKKFKYQGPFPVKDLTIYNAAIDLGMIAHAIRSFYGSSSRVLLEGFSYGAALGYTAVRLLPRVFDVARMGGTPGETPSAGLETLVEDLSGLLRHCQSDSFCNAKLDGDPKKAYEQGILALIEPKTICATHFHQTIYDQHPMAGDRKERIARLAYTLRNLTNSKFSDVMSMVHGAQPTPPFLLAFLAGSAQCKDFQLYKSILDKIAPVLIQSSGPDPSSRGILNSEFVYWVVIFSMSSSNCTGSEIIDIHESRLDIYYWRLWEEYGSVYMDEMQRPPESELETDTTFMVIATSDFDLNTTASAGVAVYNNIDAKKRLLSFKNHTHDSYINVCSIRLWKSLIYSVPMETDLDACIAAVNAEPVVDWTMKSLHPDLRSVWGLVKSPSRRSTCNIL